MDLAKLKQVTGNKLKDMSKSATKKLKDGKNRIRVLPGWQKDEPEVFFHDFGQHYIKNEAGEMQAVYVCAERTFGKPCPVCAELARAMRSTSDTDMTALLTEARANERILVNAILMDEDATSPEILELPPTVFKGILGLFDEYGNVLDPNEGRDIIVKREGKGKNTKYEVMPAAKESAVPVAVLKKLHDLSAYVDQATDEKKTRAISAISTVAGLLPAGTSARAIAAPKAPAGGVEEANDKLAAAAASTDEVDLGEDIDSLLGDLETGT